MKKFICVILMIWLVQLNFSGDASAAQPFKESGWTYFKEIRTESPGSYTSVYLDQEVYAHAKTSLGDLRVIDSSGENVPFYIIQGTSATEEISKEYQGTFVQMYIKDNNTFHDFQLRSTPGQDILVNRLALSVKSPSYFFNTQVWGSYDDNNWTFIGDYKIYKVDVADRSYIELGAAVKYPYFRIMLTSNAQGIEITGLKGQYSQRVERYQRFARTANLEFTSRSDQKTTNILIKNPSLLHLQSFNLKTSGNFYRRYHLYGVANNTSQEILSGTINATRINENIAENTSITIPPSHSSLAEYNLVIDDQDDKPIILTAIEGVFFVDKLVFASVGGEQYRLIYGNPQASKPVYDIERYKSSIETGVVAEAALGPEGQIEKEQSKEPFANYQKIILNTIVIITSVLLVFLITRRVKIKDLGE